MKLQALALKIRLETQSGLDMFHSIYFNKEKVITEPPIKPKVQEKKTISAVWRNNLIFALKKPKLIIQPKKLQVQPNKPQNDQSDQQDTLNTFKESHLTQTLIIKKRSRSTRSQVKSKFLVSSNIQIRRKSCEGEQYGRLNKKMAKFATIAAQSWLQQRIREEERLARRKKSTMAGQKKKMMKNPTTIKQTTVVDKEVPSKQNIFSKDIISLQAPKIQSPLVLSSQFDGPTVQAINSPNSPNSPSQRLRKLKSKSYNGLIFLNKFVMNNDDDYGQPSRIEGSLLQKITYLIEDKNIQKRYGSQDEGIFSQSMKHIPNIQESDKILEAPDNSDQKDHFILQDDQFRRIIKPIRPVKISIQINDPKNFTTHRESLVSPGTNTTPIKQIIHQRASQTSFHDDISSSQGGESCSLTFVQNGEQKNRKDKYKKILNDYKKQFDFLQDSNKYKTSKTVQKYVENTQSILCSSRYPGSVIPTQRQEYIRLLDMVNLPQSQIPQTQGSNRSFKTLAMLRSQSNQALSSLGVNNLRLKRKSLQSIYKVDKRQIYTSAQTVRSQNIIKNVTQQQWQDNIH